MRFRVITALAFLALLGPFCGPRAEAQFETRASLPTGGISYSLALGDFNRDGVLDLAVGDDSGSGSVKIFLGNGDGTFRLGPTYAVNVLFSAATASLRGNRILDLVFGGENDEIYGMFGNGDGTFQSAVAYPTSAFAYMIGIGDFTGRGKLDIVAVEGTNIQGANCSCIEILPGNGDGTFGPGIAASLPYGLTAYALATGDFNNDGNLDVAVEGEAFPNYEIAILLGNGDGTFTAGGSYTIGGTGASIATGSFTGNKKKIDLAVTGGGSLAVLLGNGDGTFQQATYYKVGIANAVTALDLNGDGRVDLAATGAGPAPRYQPGVNALNGNGDGTFQSAVFYPAGLQPEYIAAGDLNGDHEPDLVLLDIGADDVITLLNTGVVSFSPTTPLNFKNQPVGTTSPPQTVKLTNTGTTELKIQSMKASSEFGMSSTCGKAVTAGATCTLSATFSPTKQGSAQGTITIIDSASTKPQVIELLGTGT